MPWCWRSPGRRDRRRTGWSPAQDLLTCPRYVLLMAIPMRISVGAPESRAAFHRGFVAGVPFIVSNGVAGAVMGVAYRGVGLDVVSAVSFSVVVYSATAQAVTLGLWVAPPPLLAMVVACMATNARYLVMG